MYEPNNYYCQNDPNWQNPQQPLNPQMPQTYTDPLDQHPPAKRLRLDGTLQSDDSASSGYLSQIDTPIVSPTEQVDYNYQHNNNGFNAAPMNNDQMGYMTQNNPYQMPDGPTFNNNEYQMVQNIEYNQMPLKNGFDAPQMVQNTGFDTQQMPQCDNWQQPYGLMNMDADIGMMPPNDTMAPMAQNHQMPLMAPSQNSQMPQMGSEMPMMPYNDNMAPMAQNPQMAMVPSQNPQMAPIPPMTQNSQIAQNPQMAPMGSEYGQMPYNDPMAPMTQNYQPPMPQMGSEMGMMPQNNQCFVDPTVRNIEMPMMPQHDGGGWEMQPVLTHPIPDIPLTDVTKDVTGESLNLPNNMKLFCRVPGRLSLLGSNKKIEISVAEMQRRFNEPECLNKSILGAMCRLAKNKEGGDRLNELLETHGINVACGRRKASKNSVFTALCETESLQLSKDLNDLTAKHFPMIPFVYQFFHRMTNEKEFNEAYSDVYHVYEAIWNTVQVLSRDNSSLASAPLHSPLTMHPNTQRMLSIFTHLTHGFGTVTLVSSWTYLLNLFHYVLQVFGNPQLFLARTDKYPTPGVFAYSCYQKM